MREERASVLIVGAGLAGLSTALFLGLHGVRAVVVDRHPSTSNQPKARGQMPPIMEAFQVAGVADEIVAAMPPGKPEMTIAICESVTGRQLHSYSEAFPDFPALSPAPVGMASQQRAEAALARRAAELGADLRFSTRFASFEQDDDGVHAVLRDLATDEQYRIDAQYLVAADGHRGTIAGEVGIELRGRAHFGRMTTTLFTADIADRLPDSAILMYYAQHPDLPEGAGAFVSTDLPGEYVVGVAADPERTEEQTVELIRKVVGLDVPITTKGSNTWEIAHRVADRLSEGRVFLVGDAAHLMPPTGGQGGNTALIDGLHLAWKLAAVINGHAGPGLLASHSDEHLPYDRAVADWQYANMIERQRPDHVDDDLPAPVDPSALGFGYRRTCGAFVVEDGDDGELFEDPYKPSGRPGTRAPHVVLRRGTTPVSTRELCYRGFVLLTGDPGWVTAADAVAARRGLPLEAHHIGGEPADPQDAWATAYGVPADGAVLIRPDGVIGWRTATPPDAASLDAVLTEILDRRL
jgi:putative polyketide hydroxylase